jgi:hypothetical protein
MTAPEPKRRPGDKNPGPDTTELDHLTNVTLSGSAGHGGAPTFGGPGQDFSLVSAVFRLLQRRKQRKAHKQAVAQRHRQQQPED